MQARLAPARIPVFTACLARFKLGHHVSVGTCRRLLGLMAAASPVLPLGLLHKFLSLRAAHVPGILNLADDFLSRQKLRPGEWMLNRQTVSQIWDLFGKAEVDLFASQESSQYPLWFSLTFPTTLGIDAFAHPWPNVSLYAFPPIKLIPAVLCRMKVSSARLLLIAPFWPSQTWFSELTCIGLLGRFRSGGTCCPSFRARSGILNQSSGSCGYGPYRAMGCDECFACRGSGDHSQCQSFCWRLRH